MNKSKHSSSGDSESSPKDSSTNGNHRKINKNPTLKDLEKVTGVSKSTISRVFNNPDRVKKSTLKLVQRKAEEIGYIPSNAARRLQAGDGKSKLIGLIIPDILNPFFAEITRGIEDVVLSNGYSLIFNISDENEKRQKRCLDTLRMEGVDGIILPPVSEENDHVRQLIENGLKVVCVDRKLLNTTVDTITSDNEMGAYMAVSHLIEQGHTRIAFIGGIPSLSTTQDRMFGYKRALTEHKLGIDEELILNGDSRQESAESLTEQLLGMENPPTALFTGNNMITLGAYVAINRAGIKIPDDIAIVGYDDVPWASALTPPPTVIDQTTYEIGQKAAETMLSVIEQPESSSVTIKVTPRLVIRGSCGKNKSNGMNN